MKLSGEHKIPANAERVWDALNDPEILRRAIPGAEEVTQTGDNQFQAVVRIKIGPVSGRFRGKVTLEDKEPPNRFRLKGEGQGGAAGFAKGEAVVTLRQDGDDTILSYQASASVGGKLAQIGQRLVDSFAAKMADRFFSAFSQIAAGDAQNTHELLDESISIRPYAYKILFWIAGLGIAALVTLAFFI